MRNGQYVNVEGVRVYYEVYGNGPAVVLLHGGLATAESWDLQIADLAKKFTVYVPERRGHGRTLDTAAEFSYREMTRETIGFLEAVGIGCAHLVGWSDGAIVAMLLAIERPALVDRMALISGNVTVDGYTQKFRDEMEAMTAETCPAEFFEWYLKTSPEGIEHFPTVFAKTKKLWLTDEIGSMEMLAAIDAPTLIVNGDHDVVRIEHATEMFRAIPGARLFIVPGTTHLVPHERPELLHRALHDFLPAGER